MNSIGGFIMRKSKIIFSICTLLFFGTQSYQNNTASFLTPISQEHLDAERKNIDRLITRNTLMRYALVGSICGLAAGGVWYVWQPSAVTVSPTLSSELPSHVAQEQIPGLLQKNVEELSRSRAFMQDQASVTLALRGQLAKLGVDLDGDVTWKAWGNSWIRFFGQQFTAGLIMTGIGVGLAPVTKYFNRLDNWLDTTIGKLFHERTVNWFTHTHTHIKGMLELLKKDMQKAVREDIIRDWQLIRRDIIRIVSFIRYRSEKCSLSPESQLAGQRLQAVGNSILELYEKTRINLQAQLDHSQGAYQSESVLSYEQEIGTALKDCALIESLLCV